MYKKEKKQDHRNTYRIYWYALLVCAIISAGCAEPTSAPPKIKVLGSALYVKPDQGIDKSDLMEFAEDVLGEMYFTIEKADVDSGLIRTRPLPGAQFFEFWRSDNIGAKNTFAANLHTLRRTVTLDISQQNPPGDDLCHKELRTNCNVHVQRLSLPEQQVNSSARVYGMLSRSSPSLQRLQLNPEQKKEMAWIDMGRDSQLEAEILKRIETQIVKRINQRLQTTEKET
ncbi:MAG: hypothetical protein JXA81_08265 [Sedimentisphaerales bacterium]|nr:hypothetical protein [Sedimentisphaerales bacterium]